MKSLRRDAQGVRPVPAALQTVTNKNHVWAPDAQPKPTELLVHTNTQLAVMAFYNLGELASCPQHPQELKFQVPQTLGEELHT